MLKKHMKQVLSLVVILFSGFTQAQTVDSKLQDFVEKYKNGTTVSSDSWMIDMDGDTVSIKDYSGKWLLIDYWSISCRPCLKDLPSLAEFAKNHDLGNLEVIALSVDPEKERWKKVSPKRVSSLPNYYAGRDIENDLFGLNLSLVEGEESSQLVTTLPMYSLIDPNGVIRKKKLEVKPSDPNFSSYISSLIN